MSFSSCLSSLGPLQLIRRCVAWNLRRGVLPEVKGRRHWWFETPCHGSSLGALTHSLRLLCLWIFLPSSSSSSCVLLLMCIFLSSFFLHAFPYVHFSMYVFLYLLPESYVLCVCRCLLFTLLHLLLHYYSFITYSWTLSKVSHQANTFTSCFCSSFTSSLLHSSCANA